MTNHGWKEWGTQFFSGLGFTLIAFIAALMFENDRERRRVEGDEARELARAQNEATLLSSQLITEMRRRLRPIHRELQVNEESLSQLDTMLQVTDPSSLAELGRVVEPPVEGRTFLVLNPQLLDGAWQANAARLTQLVADYELTGDLAFTYGRIEELRWRLRYRTEHLDAGLDPMIVPLVAELSGEVRSLLVRLRNAIDNPPDQPLGLLHNVGLTDLGIGAELAH